MNDHETERRPDFTKRSFSVVVGTFVLATCAFVGYIGYTPFTSELIIPWPISILTYLRLWWTAPLGVVAMLLLIRKDASMQPGRSALINTAVFFVTLAALALCTYFLGFKMYEVDGGRHAKLESCESRQDAEGPPAGERSETPPKVVFITPSTAEDHGVDLAIEKVSPGLMHVRLFGPANVSFHVHDTNGQLVCTSRMNADHGYHNVDIKEQHLGQCSFTYPYPVPVGGTEIHIVSLVDKQNKEMEANDEPHPPRPIVREKEWPTTASDVCTSDWTIRVLTYGAPWDPSFTTEINADGACRVFKRVAADDASAEPVENSFSLSAEETKKVYVLATRFMEGFRLSEEPSDVGCGTGFQVEFSVNDSNRSCGLSHLQDISHGSEDISKLVEIINTHLPTDGKVY